MARCTLLMEKGKQVKDRKALRYNIFSESQVLKGKTGGHIHTRSCSGSTFSIFLFTGTLRKRRREETASFESCFIFFSLNIDVCVNMCVDSGGKKRKRGDTCVNCCEDVGSSWKKGNSFFSLSHFNSSTTFFPLSSAFLHFSQTGNSDFRPFLYTIFLGEEWCVWRKGEEKNINVSCLQFYSHFLCHFRLA